MPHRVRDTTSASITVRGKKLDRLRPRRKPAKLAIVRIMLGGVRRPVHDELLAVLFDQRGEPLAVERRHMPRAAMRAIVVAGRRPLIGPDALAARAFVEVEKPGHNGFLRHDTN
jgi:hypothetical protein